MFGGKVDSIGDSPVFRFGEVINVEDDKYRSFRAQVRVVGMTDDKRGIPDEDLPWYTTLMPSTSPSLAGSGASSGLEPGSKVLVLILDFPYAQHGVIMGSHYPGPSSPSHISPLAKGLEEKGPPLPKGPDGNPLNIGIMGNIGITDIFQNALKQFSELLEKSKIFKTFNIWKG